MLETVRAALETLGEHVGAAAWALAVFACGFLFAFAVVRYEVRSLLAFPLWLIRLARKYLHPGVNPFGLCAFIFAFNSVAIFCYMISGGLIYLPMVFDFLTGMNVGIIMLKDVEEPLAEPEDPDGPPPKPRAWIGFLGIFVVVVELSTFWLAIGMGIKLGHIMQAEFSWERFLAAAEPRVLAYLVLLVPALATSAAAEAAAIKGMMGYTSRVRQAGDDGDTDAEG